MDPSQHTEINRQNAAHSTGPVTPEGKRRSSLNALRHGLTGQTVVLPSDDLAAYRESCRKYHAELKPSGLLETEAVQTMADTTWRLHRVRAMENNLFALGFEAQSTSILNDDPIIHAALAQAKAMEAHSDVLVRLSLYEQRLNRTLLQAEAKLKQLQQERHQAERQSLKEAADIAKLKKHRNEPWQPKDSGFEFSSERLAAWTGHEQLLNQAYDHRRNDVPRGVRL